MYFTRHKTNLKINDKGLCNSKCSLDKVINWNKRFKEFKILIDKVKNNKSIYDCIIPVSGKRIAMASNDST